MNSSIVVRRSGLACGLTDGNQLERNAKEWRIIPTTKIAAVCSKRVGASSCECLVVHCCCGVRQLQEQQGWKGLLDRCDLHHRNAVFSFDFTASSDDDNKSWLKTCKEYPELAKELPRSQYMSAIGMTEPHEPANNIVGCIALTESATVHSPRYLPSLWKYVELHSAKAQWHTSVCSPDNIHEKMAHHDVVIIAGGFASTAFFSIEPKVKFVRGRNLHYRSKQPHPEVASSMSALSPVLSGEYIVPRYERLARRCSYP